jgi:hypothetical protein
MHRFFVRNLFVFREDVARESSGSSEKAGVVPKKVGNSTTRTQRREMAAEAEN